VKRLIGRSDMEDALKRLDKLTQEEARMAVAQILKVTHTVDEGLRGVADTVVTIDNRMANVNDQVADVNDRVARVDDRVAVLDDRMAIVNDRVAIINDRVASIDLIMRQGAGGLEQIRSSSSPSPQY
jgi:methyl-accepting chemotaxis protein